MTWTKIQQQEEKVRERKQQRELECNNKRLRSVVVKYGFMKYFCKTHIEILEVIMESGSLQADVRKTIKRSHT